MIGVPCKWFKAFQALTLVPGAWKLVQSRPNTLFSLVFPVCTSGSPGRSLIGPEKIIPLRIFGQIWSGFVIGPPPQLSGVLERRGHHSCWFEIEAEVCRI